MMDRSRLNKEDQEVGAWNKACLPRHGSTPRERAQAADYSTEAGFSVRLQGLKGRNPVDFLALRLHERICAGTEVRQTCEALAGLFFEPLIGWLCGRFPGTP